MEKIAVLWNPITGSGDGQAAFLTVTEELSRRGLPYTALKSEKPGHLTEAAAQAADAGAETVLILGGDGTVREAAKGLVGKSAALGIIPCGSGNDLARALRLPFDPVDALNTALSCKPQLMDACTANDDLYFNIAGCGFDVDVLLAEQLYRKKFNSKINNASISYLLGLLRSLTHLNMRKSVITWPEGRLEGRILILAAANGTHFGGGMNVAPGADPFDGLMDVCIIHDFPKIIVPIMLMKFLSGKHISSKKYVSFFRTTEVSIECEPESSLELDGEIQPGTPAVFRILPGSLNVLAPEREEADR